MTVAQPLANNIAKQRKGNTNTYTKTFDIETSSASYISIPSPSNIIAAEQISNNPSQALLLSQRMCSKTIGQRLFICFLSFFVQ
jgi:hypothetical protein